MDNLKMHSLDGVQRNIELIGKLFPNAITEVKRDGKVEHAIDFDVLRQELSDSIVEGREERYQFTWPDKKKAMLAANAPITATLRPVVADSVGKDGTPGGFDSENLYIEGDNLEVLKLLQETYLGKVKMIYIDPPYNTSNDFVYNDDFSQSAEEYMAGSGQYDEEGNRMVTNTESNGRFHTDWLNMIYPRLRLAKDLLADDGVIFISIGCCIKFNSQKLKEFFYGFRDANLEKGLMNLIDGEVEYEIKESTRHAINYFYSIKNELMIYDEILMFCLLFKSPSFSFEHEYRMGIPFEDQYLGENCSKEFSLSGTTIRPQLELKNFPVRDIIEEITISPFVTSELTKIGIQELLISKGISPDVVRLSQIPIR